MKYHLGKPIFGDLLPFSRIITLAIFVIAFLLPSIAVEQLSGQSTEQDAQKKKLDAAQSSNETKGFSGTEESDARSTSIGLPATLKGIVINGPLLKAKKIASREQPFFVRVVESYPHGDAFRYDLEYTGLEAGNYNILEYLEPVSAESSWDRSELRVVVKALLPPNEIRPSPLDLGSSYFGNYYTAILVAGGLFWFVGLLTIIFWGRGKIFRPDTTEKPKSLADTLRPLIEKANAGELSTGEQAALERTLVAFWQKRLKLTHLDAHRLRVQLREHPEAGKTLEQVDAWLHDPQPKKVDVDEMLKPYHEVLAQGELD